MFYAFMRMNATRTRRPSKSQGPETGVTVRRLDARQWVLSRCLRTLTCQLEDNGYTCVVDTSELEGRAVRVGEATRCHHFPPRPVTCHREGEWNVCAELTGT